VADENIWKEAGGDADYKQLPPGTVEHLTDVLAVFLEHARLEPGTYPMNKLLKPIKLKFMF
jgi:hypothetical protein